jgi:hypothetical protein
MHVSQETSYFNGTILIGLSRFVCFIRRINTRTVLLKVDRRIRDHEILLLVKVAVVVRGAQVRARTRIQTH